MSILATRYRFFTQEAAYGYAEKMRECTDEQGQFCYPDYEHKTDGFWCEITVTGPT